MPSVRAIAVDPERGLVLPNVIRRGCLGFRRDHGTAQEQKQWRRLCRPCFGNIGRNQHPNPVDHSQHGIRYTTFRSACYTWRLDQFEELVSADHFTANIAESRRVPAPPVPPAQLLPPPSPLQPRLFRAGGIRRHLLRRSPALLDRRGDRHHASDPHALLGHLRRTIGVVAADGWAAAICDLAIDAQLAYADPCRRRDMLARRRRPRSGSRWSRTASSPTVSSSPPVMRQQRAA